MVAIIIDVENQANVKLIKMRKMLFNKHIKFNFQSLNYMLPSSTKNSALKSRILWGQLISQGRTVIKDKLPHKIETLIELSFKQLSEEKSWFL